MLFRPNWEAHGRAAPYKANDEMVAAKLDGVILFTTDSGIALDLGDKAEAKGLHVARIAPPATVTRAGAGRPLRRTDPRRRLPCEGRLLRRASHTTSG